MSMHRHPHPAGHTGDGRMGIGLGLPQVGAFADPALLRPVATAAERAGFDSLWTVDQLVAPVGRSAVPTSVLDPTVALTLAAAVTERIRLGTGVLIAPIHSPVVLARAAASLDRVSNGRFTLGLGLGRSHADLAAAGVPASGRQVRIEQMLEVMARVWRDEIVEIDTTRESIAPSHIDLKPRQQPRMPLLLATSRPAGLERIARRADGWIATGLPFAEISGRWSTISTIATQYGRTPGSLRLVIRADVRIAHSMAHGRAPFTGSIGQVCGDIERARDLGAHEVILDLQQTADSGSLLDLSLQLAAGSLSPATDTKAA